MYYTIGAPAGVLELVDEVDSKSTASDGVPVRARPPAPRKETTLTRCLFFIYEGTGRARPPAPKKINPTGKPGGIIIAIRYDCVCALPNSACLAGYSGTEGSCATFDGAVPAWLAPKATLPNL